MNSFKGVITALVTPFKDGKVDENSLERLIEFQLSEGIEGFVINGTTGESPTITPGERRKIFQFIQSRVPKKFPLIMGTGSNSTEKSVEDSREAEKLGADAVLVVVPYYNKPPQQGLFEHFKKIASEVRIPVILYNVPSRTITSLQLDTIKRLSEHPNILGIKEASGNIEFAKQIRQACGKTFVMLSGDDGSYESFAEVGGDGIISVCSHIIPKAMKNKAVMKNKALIDGLYIESNPIPVKMALHLMGILASPECRLPLTTLGPEKTAQLKGLMKEAGLLP